VGSNPIYGYSHVNPIFDRTLQEWFTDERLVKLLLDCEKAGINTWQASFNPNMQRQFPKVREAGCKIQFVCLAWPLGRPYDVKTDRKWTGRTPEEVLDGTIKCAQAAMQFKPNGIVFHGVATDVLFRAGKIDLVKSFIDKVHDLGVAAGISTLNPKILATLHEKGFGNDFYQTALYYVTREPEEWKKEIGTEPAGTGWIMSDPPKMAEVIRQVDKPALVYKIFAGGNKCGSEKEKREAVTWAYQHIKPTDATIVGLYPRYSDQVTETAQMVREALA
jgi:hypothetical protein